MIVVSFLVAFALTILPLPVWAGWFRPAWAPLLLIYWALALPHRVSIGFAWIVGLMLDVLQGTLLGEQALLLGLVAYIIIKLHPRIRVFPRVQQALVVFGLIVFYQTFQFWIQALLGEIPDIRLYWMPSLTSALLWFWLFIVLRDYRRHFNIS